MTVDNYLYAHTKEKGTTMLGDKYGNYTFEGDAFEKDAIIRSLWFRKIEGLEGERLYIKYPDGSTQNVTTTYVVLEKVTKSIQIVIDKKTTQETYVEVAMANVDDDAAPDTVQWTFTKTPPTSYGNLPEDGSGSGGSSGSGDITDTTIPRFYFYMKVTDEYRMNYTPPEGAVRYQLSFTAASGLEYTTDYDHAPTGIHYLTCNGTYRLYFYDANGKMIAKTKDAETYKIEAPACKSYTNQESVGRDQLQATVDENNNISWKPPSGTDKVEIWKDGEKISEQDSSDTVYENAGPGGWSVIAKDEEGNTLGQSDLNISDATGEDPIEKPGTDCGTCDKLDQLLTCPGWDTAMGDLTEAIQNALPPPPDWDDIADKIGSSTIKHLSNYLGDVPTPPSKAEIEEATKTPKPNLDATAPELDQLTPEVPDEYNKGKIEFDLNSAPEIKVEDKSEEFIITDPLANMDYDEPGKAVLPGDETNSSGGIKDPDKVDTGEAPKPGKIIFDLPRPEAPKPDTGNGETAIPNTSGGPGAVPGTDGGPGAVPGVTDSIIPIPDIK